MENKLRPFVAELIGTFILVFLGAGTVCTAHLVIGAEQAYLYFVAIALAQGFALAVALTATLNVSGGYLNPAVTVTLWVLKRFDNATTLWLLGAQLLGAVLAGGALRIIFNSEDILIASHLGTPHLVRQAFGLQPADQLSLAVLGTGAGVELILTFLFTFAIFGTVIDPRAPRWGGLGPGLALTAIVLMAYPLTGGAVNPARCFGTFFWELTFEPHADFREEVLVYWVAPIVGALLSGWVYTFAILPAAEAKASAGAATAGGSHAGVAAAPARARK